MSVKILILGGTQFVGRHLCEYLLTTGHQVTLFNRGKTNPALFPQFKHLHGDRLTSDIQQINQQDWDVVVDFSAYYPRPLREQVQALSGRVGRYVFVSTVSVYDLATAGEAEIDENTPTVTCSSAAEIDTTMMTYGQRKVACEQILRQTPAINPVIFRPGLIYGPYDPTDRAYYWLWRTQTQDKMLVAEPHMRQQWTFAPDFAQMLARAALGPALTRQVYLALTHEPRSFTEILAGMSQACERQPQQVVVNAAWMDAQDLQFWQDLPLSMPYERLFSTRSLADLELLMTPYAKTWILSRDYYAQQDWPLPHTGITPEREAELLLLATRNGV